MKWICALHSFNNNWLINIPNAANVIPEHSLPCVMGMMEASRNVDDTVVITGSDMGGVVVGMRVFSWHDPGNEGGVQIFA